MYKIMLINRAINGMVDEYKIYDDSDLELQDYQYVVVDPFVKLKDNSAGSCSFKVAYNPNAKNNTGQLWWDYSKTLVGGVTIKVYKSDNVKFIGRIISYEEEMYGGWSVECEGALAFFNDVIQPPFEYKGDVSGFLTRLLTVYNNGILHGPTNYLRKINLGVVTVKDKNDYILRYTNYETTLECIETKLIGTLGGHVFIRETNGQLYLDYFDDFQGITSQEIEFGENLLDYAANFSAEDLCTVVVPLGVMLDESPIDALYAYLTVADVNNGSIYVNGSSDLLSRYGKIQKVVRWQDVTEASNLLRKAKEYLTDTQFENIVVEISAVDLHYINPEIDDIWFGDYVRVKSSVLNLDRYYPVTSMNLPLQSPENTEYVLGNASSFSFVDSINKDKQTTQKTIDDLPTQQETIDEVKSYIEENVPDEKTLLEKAQQNAQQILNAALDAATNGYITVVEVDGHTSELLITNTPDYKKATKVWRWNINGLAYSDKGYAGPYKTAITMDGGIVADFIITGTMSANRIRGGELILGGYQNGYGNITVLNSVGKIIGRWNNNGLGVANYLSADNPFNINSLEITGNEISATITRGLGLDTKNYSAFSTKWAEDDKTFDINFYGSEFITVLRVFANMYDEEDSELFEYEFTREASIPGTLKILKNLKTKHIQAESIHSPFITATGSLSIGNSLDDLTKQLRLTNRILLNGRPCCVISDGSGNEAALMVSHNLYLLKKLIIAPNGNATSDTEIALRLSSGSVPPRLYVEAADGNPSQFWSTGDTYLARHMGNVNIFGSNGAAVLAFRDRDNDVAERQIYLRSGIDSTGRQLLYVRNSANNGGDLRTQGRITASQRIYCLNEGIIIRNGESNSGAKAAFLSTILPTSQYPYPSLRILSENQSICSVTLNGDLFLQYNAHVYQSVYVSGNCDITGALMVRSTKNRVVETEHYGQRKMSAFETAESYFSDIGSDEIPETGEAIINFDPIFAETIEVTEPYQVFLTRTSQKETSWVEKHIGYFIVHGEPGATFDWMITCKQKGYANDRMEEYLDESSNPITPDMQEEV